MSKRMGLEITYTGSDGRRHNDMAGLLKAEMQKIVDDHLDRIESALAMQRCEIHGERPLVNRNRTSDGAEFTITGCCDDLVAKAQAAADSVS
jgi:hypothetical protein